MAKSTQKYSVKVIIQNSIFLQNGKIYDMFGVLVDEVIYFGIEILFNYKWQGSKEDVGTV